MIREIIIESYKLKNKSVYYQYYAQLCALFKLHRNGTIE